MGRTLGFYQETKCRIARYHILQFGGQDSHSLLPHWSDHKQPESCGTAPSHSYNSCRTTYDILGNYSTQEGYGIFLLYLVFHQSPFQCLHQYSVHHLLCLLLSLLLLRRSPGEKRHSVRKEGFRHHTQVVWFTHLEHES